MTLREEIVAEAREWLGTPFKHQGRVKGIGADCVGLIIGIALRRGLMDHDVRGYPAQPNQQEFLSHLQRECGDPIPRDQLDLGDILTFRVEAFQHVGILSCLDPMKVIHITALYPRKCVEYTFPSYGEDRLGPCFRFPGVA